MNKYIFINKYIIFNFFYLYIIYKMDSVDYRQKYIKYKQKYCELKKNIMLGGETSWIPKYKIGNKILFNTDELTITAVDTEYQRYGFGALWGSGPHIDDNSRLIS